MDQLMQTIEEFQTSQIIITAVKLDLFSKLEEKNYSIEELSKKTNLSKEGLERVLTALEDISLISSKKKSGGKQYFTTKLATKCFGNDGILKNWVKHQGTLYSIWENLPSSIRSGKPILKKTHDIDVQSYALGLLENYSLNQKKIHDVVKLDGPILDIGGGAGHFLMEALRENKKLTGYLLDRKDITNIAKNQISKNKLQKRISIITGDALKTKWPKQIKTILISNMLHGRTKEDVQKIIKKSYYSLNKGGKLLINEWIKGTHYDVSRFDINMFLCSNGSIRTKDELKKIVKNNGFKNLKWKKLSHTHQVLICEK